MNLLFYLPKCHLSIYIISHLLYHLPSVTLYVILPTHSHLSVHEYWSHLIQKYKLEYIYSLSKTNIQNLHLIPFDQMKKIESFLKKEMDSFFYILPSEPNTSLSSLKRDWKFIFSFSKRVDILVPIDSIHLDSAKYFIQKMKKRENRYIYYYGLYLGEEERGISQDHFMLQEYHKSLSDSIQQKKWNQHYELMYLDDMHSLYEYVFQQMSTSNPSNFKESIFLNTKNPIKFPFQQEIQEEVSLPSYLHKWIEQYHQNMYELHKREDLHKIGYEKDICISHFFKDTIQSNENLSPNLVSTITQGILLLSFLIILFICGIFLYFKMENKHYLFIFMILLSLKLPLLMQRFYQDVLNTIPHITEFYAGNLIYEENEIQQLNQEDILYIPITPTIWRYDEQSYLQPHFPILNMIISSSKPKIEIESMEERIQYESSQNPLKKIIVPILTKSNMIQKIPKHFQWIDNIQQEIRFFSKQNKTIFGRPIPIENAEELKFEIERLFQKYK